MSADSTSFDEALHRLRSEYLEMPGLQLTVSQVARLCGIDREVGFEVLNALVAAKFLTMKQDGTYSRSSDGGMRDQSVMAKVYPVAGLRRANTVS
jgi:hypothetical protein